MEVMMGLKDRLALVTGASRGIGAATAKLLAEAGAKVIVNYNQNKEAADIVVDNIVENGGKAVAIQADARDEKQVNAMVKVAVDEFGPIDILVLNAGMDVPYKLFVDLTWEEFETKVMGEMQCFFYPLKAVIPSMIENKNGDIIGISSGLSRRPGPNFSAHTTAKSAVDGLMKSLALELGEFNIRANTIAPGLTMTDATSWMPKDRVETIAKMTPLRRVGMPEDIASAIVALLSDQFGFITGAYIPVSGGSLMI
ncbi:MAG: SDR family oxidoreductase [candidate division Zixibacteria bacterium]|nr:SDR family oxidoreductase [candidate division Zixibacteria bacterium]